MNNKLYYGDNLTVLRQHIAEESVDLVYLDPPFKSDQDYNVLFAEQDGTRSAAQIQAFKDTWCWDQAAAAAYEEVVESGGRVSHALQGLRQLLGCNDMLAYLVMMAVRLVELHRVLKPSGSIYLHCDPTAGHYLKLLMDAVFEVRNFRNQIIWKRTFAHGKARRYGPIHDMILFYSKGENYTWNRLTVPHDREYIEQHFTHRDADGRRFQAITLTGAGVTRGESGQPWRGIDPTNSGRHWALPGQLLQALGITTGTIQEKLEALDAKGMIHWPKKPGGIPRLKWYADMLEGVAVPDVWTDIPPISAHAAERMGYPTQKPERLLERIIQASSKEGDLVLDPFCGCGSTIVVAQRLKRRWIGIDITHLAISLVRHRLKTAFGEKEIEKAYTVLGEPVDLAGARQLAAQDPYQFQWWALGLIGARPVEQKRGADKGIDGRLFFHDDADKQQTKQVVISVKSGSVSVAHVRDLLGVMQREEAAIGVLISLESATRAMRAEAAQAGYYRSPWGTQHTRLQLLTVEELLAGRQPDLPPTRDLRTLKKAPQVKRFPRGRRGTTFLF